MTPFSMAAASTVGAALTMTISSATDRAAGTVVLLAGLRRAVRRHLREGGAERFLQDRSAMLFSPAEVVLTSTIRPSADQRKAVCISRSASAIELDALPQVLLLRRGARGTPWLQDPLPGRRRLAEMPVPRSAHSCLRVRSSDTNGCHVSTSAASLPRCRRRFLRGTQQRGSIKRSPRIRRNA